MIELKYPLILASKSPRRQELLEKLLVPFTVQTLEVDETIPEFVQPKEAALYLAKTKSEAYKHLASGNIVITADTVVLLGDILLNKPASGKEAFDMLSQLSGRSHEVITGVCVRSNDELHSFDTVTKVTFGTLSADEIKHYIESGSADDKAGAYGIQDWIGLAGIKSIEGCYYNVVGLPVYDLYNCLKSNFLLK